MATAPKETQRITIEGGLVRLERRLVEREARAEDFLNELARMQPLDSGLLPEGCACYRRWCDEKQSVQSVFLVERAPGMQAIRFRPVKGGVEETELLLSWPRTVWCIRTVQAVSAAFATIEECAVAVIRRPVREEGLNTKLFRLPMPNLYEDGNGPVCTGNLQLAEGRAEMAHRTGEMIRQVLESAWNDDLMPDFEGIGIEDLEDWAQQSAPDPELHERLAFKAHTAGTVDGLIQTMVRRS